MDHFEGLICTLLEAEGYWVRRSFKVSVTKEEKRAIGKPSIPRPEIDILALNFKKNEVLTLEVKSYLDSPGIALKDLMLEHEIPEGRFKLFTSKNYRSIVLTRLMQDLIACGMANDKTTIKLGMAAGKVLQNRTAPIRDFMADSGLFFGRLLTSKQRLLH